MKAALPWSGARSGVRARLRNCLPDDVVFPRRGSLLVARHIQDPGQVRRHLVQHGAHRDQLVIRSLFQLVNGRFQRIRLDQGRFFAGRDGKQIAQLLKKPYRSRVGRLGIMLFQRGGRHGIPR
jgi:hypothetical protein